MENIYILAIESSCDETSASIVHNGKILNNIVATQKVHEKYGGVVPELASRDHQKNIVPIVEEALNTSGIKKEQLSAIAFTQGPGLLGALLIGATFAKTMAYALDIPLIGVHHMKAHIMAHFIDDPKPEFPFMCLTVSGGHTQIVLVESPTKMEVLGTTIDDAVGEAFDKTAKLLSLPYPGGPVIDRLAKEGTPIYPFSEPKIAGFDYSFSGVKTSILYFLRKEIQKDPDFIEKNINDICASVQHNLIGNLMKKFTKAIHEYKVKHVGIAGGVSANSGLRKTLEEAGEKHGWKTYTPDFQYCTDNAGMIAMMAYYQYLDKDFCDIDVSPMPRMPF